MRANIVLLRDVLLNLDVVHAEMVHGALFLHHIRPEIYQPFDRRKAEKYRHLCISFFRANHTLLERMADYACVLMGEMYKIEKAETGKHEGFDKAERAVLHLSTKRVRRIMKRPTAAYLNAAYSNIFPSLWDFEQTMRQIAPVLRQTIELVNGSDFYSAVGNFDALFRALYRIRKRHPEWYAEDLDASTNLADILTFTRCLYCKMRGKDDLHAYTAENIDHIPAILNARYGMIFGDWKDDSFTDMVNGNGQQSRDYSQIETWPVFSSAMSSLTCNRPD